MTTHIDHRSEPVHPSTDQQAADIDSLVAGYVAITPKLEPQEARIAIGLLRMLGEGDPVRPGPLAGRLRMRAPELMAALNGVLAPAVLKDEHDRIVAFWGLSLPVGALTESPHEIEVGGRTLYAWCAPDTLFLPRLLGTAATVRSTMKTTGEPISLVVRPDGIERSSVDGAAVSFVRPQGKTIGGTVTTILSTFCHHMLFFPSMDSGLRWARERQKDVVILPVDHGFEVERRWVEEVFAPAL